MPFYYNVMSEIYKEDIENSGNIQEGDTGTDPTKPRMNTDQIRQSMMQNNQDMDQNPDAAYHLNRELQN